MLKRLRSGLLAAMLLCVGCAPGGVVVHETAPAALSAWGLMTSDGQQLQLGAGVTPYQLNATLFTDYAHKLRTVSLPPGTQATVMPDGRLDFPLGTVISKTFFYPRVSGALVQVVDAESVLDASLGRNGGLDLTQVQLIETRLLVRRSSGWVGLPYVWNATQTEASLEVTGDIKSLTLVHQETATATDFPYIVPDQNQCAGCHNTDTASRQMNPIGPRLANLNRSLTGKVPDLNQLDYWQQLGILQLDGTVADQPRLVAWQDATQNLNDRARSYLDSNCGHCHSSTGAGDTSGLYLDIGTNNPVRLGECKLPIAAGQGTGGHRFSIVPGDPEHSILVFRMQTRDPGAMMPELGRSLVHAEGVDLISAWIAALPGHCS
ncbi:MAG: SO2930 family diheme c-type cytochrome [SAR86 cluster bacterium]|jgi:uncharacterized repeat protein (TIGR03806 family)|uniref:Cytochrome c domain-containing protein n=1 Tax=SAR86 cluster bacterium TaxID=2030880 RepID=A0A972VUD7_9GAMM|nr:hypothetical protein [SAR86 cluster bacterium]|tara:strand:+ start:27783 stop:28913 length:1131 start_codon:yes stop_codon:yes gene_type:complete